MICMRCIVSGRVQGVWFRDSTRQKAGELAISGHAINLPDGCVEVLACGESEKLEILKQWLYQGPELAEVTSVNCEPVAGLKLSGFSIG